MTVVGIRETECGWWDADGCAGASAGGAGEGFLGSGEGVTRGRVAGGVGNAANKELVMEPSGANTVDPFVGFVFFGFFALSFVGCNKNKGRPKRNKELLKVK